MKTDQKRPRGPRTLLRGCALALLALVAPGVASDAAQGAGLPQGKGDRTTVTDLPEGAGQLVTAPDGFTWAWLGGWPGGAWSAAPGGQAFTAVSGSADHGRALGVLTPLADGSVGIVVDGGWGSGGGSRPLPRLLRLGPGGIRAQRTLPRVVADSPAPLVQPDGAVWSARSCGDAVTRVSASGAVRRFRLPRLACHHVDDVVQPERSQTLVAGSDGAVWIANACQGRVVRIDRRERVRTWRVPSSCVADVGTERATLPTPAHADADGGLRLPGIRISPRGGVTRSAGISTPDVVTPDGSEWTLADDGATIALRPPAGAARTIDLRGATGRFAWSVAAGADGRLWAVAADSPRRRGDNVFDQARGERVFAAISPDGEIAARTLPSAGPVRWRSTPPLLTAGADGFAWVAESGALDAPSYADFRRLVRIDVGAATPPAPRARLTASLGRDGGRLWLQLSCTAAPGRWCRATVSAVDRRGRGLFASPVRSVLPATGRAAVAATLSPRALADSRRAPLRARVTVRTADGHATTTTVTIPRGARR